MYDQDIWRGKAQSFYKGENKIEQFQKVPSCLSFYSQEEKREEPLERSQFIPRQIKSKPKSNSKTNKSRNKNRYFQTTPNAFVSCYITFTLRRCLQVLYYRNLFLIGSSQNSIDHTYITMSRSEGQFVCLYVCTYIRKQGQSPLQGLKQAAIPKIYERVIRTEETQ